MADWRIRQVDRRDAAAVLAADVFDGPALADAVERFLGAEVPPNTSAARTAAASLLSTCLIRQSAMPVSLRKA